MATTGTVRNSKKQQAINAELELIIEEFGNAMRNAYKPYIARTEQFCPHAGPAKFTPNMERAWYKYVEWCQKYNLTDGR